jgi:hypothetical protein
MLGHRRWLSVAAVVLVIVMAAAIHGRMDATLAQQEGLTLPMAPGPEYCTAEPRGIEEYQVFVGTPEATNLPPIVIPSGVPADQATIDGVTLTVIGVQACRNAGDYVRLGGLYTDAGFVEDTGSNGLNQEMIDFLATTPQPVPVAERQIVHAVFAVQVLADGRVAAIVQWGPDGTWGVDLMLFVEEDGKYLIDLWTDEPFDIRPTG